MASERLFSRCVDCHTVTVWNTSMMAHPREQCPACFGPLGGWDVVVPQGPGVTNLQKGASLTPVGASTLSPPVLVEPPCPVCYDPRAWDCRCVRRRTFRERISVDKAIGTREPLGRPAWYLPTGNRPGRQTELRAPMHTGGLWTCRHSPHDPTDQRGR